MSNSICYYSTKTVLASLDISLTTLRRSVVFLREKLGAETLDKDFGERGFSSQTCQILTLYFEIRKQGASRERAARYVKDFLTNHQQSA